MRKPEHKKAGMLMINIPARAEEEGFEPPVPSYRDDGFQDRSIKPLWHSSFFGFMRGGMKVYEV